MALLLFIFTLNLVRPPQVYVSVKNPVVIIPEKKVLGQATAKNCVSYSDLNVLVDKDHPVPADFIPADPDLGVKQFQKMGIKVPVVSAYRSFADQQKIYNVGDFISAKPGYSEHQLGTAVDLKIKYPSKEWTWLDQNAHKFGFIMSYRYNQSEITGYPFEPWHWRFVGIDLATKIRFSKNPPQSFYKPAGCN